MSCSYRLAVASGKILSDEELALLRRFPRQEVGEAADDPERMAAVADRWANRYAGVMVGLRTWVATIEAHLLDTSPEAAAAGLADEEQFLRMAPPPEPSNDVDEIRRCAEGGDAEGALAAWDTLESGLRSQHDWWVDRVSVLLSHVYRHHGVEGLTACLRRSGKDFLLPWMPFDIVHRPEHRLAVWVAVAKGNCGTVADIEEDDEKFAVTLDPCGSCGRQVAERPYPGPYDLATVKEAAPITSGRTGMTVYRTHVAVIHHILPLEQRGVPWPVIECPGPRAGGPCRFLLYKDPDDPAARDRLAAYNASAG